MQDGPTGADILDAVIARLSTVVAPQLEGRLKFEVRVAERALRLVRRELALAPGSDARERERLTALLGLAPSTTLDAANRLLCERIEADDPALDAGALLVHLRATALEKLAVDQPDYPPLKLATGS